MRCGFVHRDKIIGGREGGKERRSLCQEVTRHLPTNLWIICLRISLLFSSFGLPRAHVLQVLNGTVGKRAAPTRDAKQI